MTVIKLPWGRNEKIEISLPDGWRMFGELLPRPAASVLSPEAAVCEALARPVGKQPLSSMDLKGKRVTVVVDDLTRPTPVAAIFKPVLEELLLAGAALADITVLIALGTHRAMTRGEIGQRLGRADLTGLRVANHDCYNPRELAVIENGESGFPVIINRHIAEADLAVLIGTVEPHLLAGFSGGLKNAVPGCAGIDTIAATHLAGPSEARFSSVGLTGENCLTRRGLERAALAAPTEYFIVNTVVNPDGKLTLVLCGDPVEAHRVGCRAAGQIYGVQVKEKSDVAFLASHPMDIDFRQGTKCLAHGRAAVKEGGVLAAFLYCEAGVGDMSMPPAFLPVHLAKLCLSACTAEEWVNLREKFTGRLDHDTRYMLEFLTEVARRRHVLVFCPRLPRELEESLGTIELFHNQDLLLERAKELAPKTASVCSLPFGGSTYVTSLW